MPLLKDGKLVDDVWAFVADGHELAPGGCVTVSLKRYLAEHEQLAARNEATVAASGSPFADSSARRASKLPPS